MRFAFIRAEKAYSVAWMCRRFDVSRSGFYAWCGREPSMRSRRDSQLGVKVAEAFARGRRTYGSTRVHRELRKAGEPVSRRRVSRLMRERGLCAKPKRRFVKTTDSKHAFAVAPNVLARNFEATAPNRAWVADITYVSTWEGWLYVAIILDLYSRRVVGFAVDDHMRTELPLEALSMALRVRQPMPGLVHHSDRGSQYASTVYRAAVVQAGAASSMSRKGNCWDNAVAESFFATLKGDLIDREVWPTKERAKAAIREYIECFYNSRRSHSALAYVSPMEYELAASTFTKAA